MNKGKPQLSWTVVQHSGYGYGHKPGFKRGLVPMSVEDKTSRTSVEQAGGLLFETYTAADKYSETEMYPEGYKGLYPIAPGRFSHRKAHGLKIYIPKGEDPQ